MKYKNLNFTIKQEQRKAANENILKSIKNKTEDFTKEQIFNAYTGKGKLHGISFNDSKNFHEYTEAKKEVEMGQFYTPFDTAKQITSLLKISNKDTVLDPMGGIGVFGNFVNERNFTSVDIDSDNTLVSKYLFPLSNIHTTDLKYWRTGDKFDFIVTNPAFNIKFSEGVNSQDYVLHNAKKWLVQNGIFAAIVPASYLQDDMYYKKNISFINQNYNWIGQYELNNKQFKNYNLNFPTKVIFFQNSYDINDNFSSDYNSIESISEKIEKAIIKKTKEKLKSNVNNYERHGFNFLVSKYLYEMSQHEVLKDNVEKALKLLDKLKNQVKPYGVSDEEWSKQRLTENKVLSHIKKYAKVTKPHVRSKNCLKTEKSYASQKIAFNQIQISPVYQKYVDNFQFKSEDKTFNLYDKQGEQCALHLHKQHSLINMEMGTGKTPVGHAIAEYRLSKGVKKVIVLAPSIAIKTWKHHLKTNSIGYTELNDKSNLDYLFNNNSDYILISLNKIGKRNRTLSPNENLINEFKKSFKEKQKEYDFNSKLIIGSKDLIKSWEVKFNNDNTSYSTVTNLDQLDDTIMSNPDYIFVPNYTIDVKQKQNPVYNSEKRFRTLFKKHMRRMSNNVQLIFDESHTVKNITSNSYKAAFELFKSCRYKLLMTGTTVLNNLGELYPQLNLLYNNSNAMTNQCRFVFKYDKNNKLTRKKNHNFQEKFSAYHGFSNFKAAFSPEKKSVFGVKKQEQNLFNHNQLKVILDYTLTTKTFIEMCGERYKTEQVFVEPSLSERNIHRKILTEYDRIASGFYNTYTNGRKNAGMRMLRIMNLMLKACSTPQEFEGFTGTNSKMTAIIDKVNKIDDMVCVGCTSIYAAECYRDAIKATGRKVFFATGETPQRDKIVKEFRESGNGVLVCTQQAFSSSLNIPECNHVICETMLWNMGSMMQFCFRFIRFNSKNVTTIYMVRYNGTIENNKTCLLMTKQKLSLLAQEGNEELDVNDIAERYGIDYEKEVAQTLSKEKDDNGKIQLTWGQQDSFD